ncbi:hypothetical protein B0T24DRAFT_387398 [Lasiosphaeria ovina]|uniref:Uncharacterized protein n=1 Tax=Lasiosphaeria ovina TaxID=92902 RepID=A0AAE0JZN2_9PEZI|nr:hypothetical protein B0T24DRAFT_387398 [Lasiosphaeria ovina]
MGRGVVRTERGDTEHELAIRADQAYNHGGGLEQRSYAAISSLRRPQSRTERRVCVPDPMPLTTVWLAVGLHAGSSVRVTHCVATTRGKAPGDSCEPAAGSLPGTQPGHCAGSPLFRLKAFRGAVRHSVPLERSWQACATATSPLVQGPNQHLGSDEERRVKAPGEIDFLAWYPGGGLHEEGLAFMHVALLGGRGTLATKDSSQTQPQPRPNQTNAGAASFPRVSARDWKGLSGLESCRRAVPWRTTSRGS